MIVSDREEDRHPVRDMVSWSRKGSSVNDGETRGAAAASGERHRTTSGRRKACECEVDEKEDKQGTPE